MPYVEDPGGLDEVSWKKGAGSVRDRVLRLAREAFVPRGYPEHKVTEDLRFLEDVEADSLEWLSWLMTVEEEFGVSIPDRDVERFRKLGDLISSLEGRS